MANSEENTAKIENIIVSSSFKAAIEALVARGKLQNKILDDVTNMVLEIFTKQNKMEDESTAKLIKEMVEQEWNN